ncbi:hypothetical protein F4703DRAFT_1429066 [Phycomyces blakesleeanus]
MPSSTLTDSHTSESWLHMQQQSHGMPHTTTDRTTRLLAARRASRATAEQDTRFARSTASSRSRLTAEDEIKLESKTTRKEDAGMSRAGIFEAFAEAEKNLSGGEPQWPDKRQSAPQPQPTTRATATATATAITTANANTNTNLNSNSYHQRKMSLADNENRTSVPITLRRKSTIEPKSSTRRSQLTADNSTPETRINGRVSSMNAMAMRRKSTAVTNDDSPAQSPRVRALNTKKSSESLPSRPSPIKSVITRRRSTVVAAMANEQQKVADLNATTDYERQQQRRAAASAENNNNSAVDVMSPRQRPQTTRMSLTERNSQGTPSGSLANAFKDTITIKRTTAKHDPGLYPDTHRRKSYVTNTNQSDLLSVDTARSGLRDLDDRRKSVACRQDLTTAERLGIDKRRMSLGNRKIKEVEAAAAGSGAAATAAAAGASAAREPRRRTLSTNTSPAGTEAENNRRKSVISSRATPNPNNNNNNNNNNTNANTNSNGNLLHGRASTLANRRRSVVRSRKSSAGSSTAEDDHEPSASRSSRPRAVLECKAQRSRASSSSSGGPLGGSGDEEAKKTLSTRTSKASLNLNNSTNNSNGGSGGAGSKVSNVENYHQSSLNETTTIAIAAAAASTTAAAAAYLRTRKKSIVPSDEPGYPNRRMQRTESLKEGIPTDSSINAAMMVREKSQASHDVFARRMSRNAKTPVAATSTYNTEDVEVKKTTRVVRKRGTEVWQNLHSCQVCSCHP